MNDAIDAGIFDAAELQDAQQKLPEAVFRELYFAEASDDEGNPFGLVAIRACVQPLSDRAPAVWGWDLAKSVDWTVGVALDEDGRVCRLERFQRSWEDTFAMITTVTDHVPALVDSTGVGDPILERLQRVGHAVEGLKFTPGSKQQLMEGLAVAIQQRRVSFPDGPIVAELEAFEYEYTRTGVQYTAPPGMHDDCVCALALAVQLYAREVDGPPLRLINVPDANDTNGESYVERQVRLRGSWFPGDG